MAVLPPIPITGTVISRYFTEWQDFTDDRGKTVPAGRNYWVWLFIGDDTEPLKVKNMPREVEPGEVVSVLVREQFGQLVAQGMGDAAAAAKA